VWEFCSDWYGKYPAGTLAAPAEDPYSFGSLGPVHRGGSCCNLAGYARSATRTWNAAGDRPGNTGFRLARTL
jgi:formylglycine-generating enzyme required for sulfatase activity